MHRYYCTYFDKNYLVKALAMIRSLTRYGGEFTLYAICLDDLTYQLMQRLNLPRVVPVPLGEIEAGDAELLAAKANRSIVEYYWTLTPTVLLRVLTGHPEIELLTYLDADLYFFGSPEPIFDELAQNSVLIHGHRFPEKLKHLEIYGKYNVGLLCFRRDRSGFEVLDWWRERCNEWCYCTIEDGKYGDQLYLDHWPDRFCGVRVLEHIGAGVAPWNHIQYRFRTEPGGEAYLDDQRMIFYHFHSLDFVRPGIVVPAKFLQYPLREDIVRHCFLPYLQELCRSMETVWSVHAGFSFGLINDRLLAPEHTVLAAKAHAEDLARIGIDHLKIDLDGFWECHASGQMHPPAPSDHAAAPQVRGSAELPRISLVIPSCNCGQYLEACLDSVLSQNYPNLELILLDGGSTDHTPAVIAKYRGYLSYCSSQRGRGRYSAIEEGLNRATGDVMGWLNADAMLHPGALRALSEVFASSPEVEWLMGRPNSFDAQGRQQVVRTLLPLVSRRKCLAGQEPLQQEGVFWRRILWQRSGASIDQELKFAADLDLWARFLRSAQLYSVDTLIAGFRDHPQQMFSNTPGYGAEAELVLARERRIFEAEPRPFSPPPPLPIIVSPRT